MQPRLLPNLTLTGTRQIAEAKRIADEAAADRKRDEAQAAKVAEAKAALARRIRYGIAQYGMRYVFVLDRVVLCESPRYWFCPCHACNRMSS